MNILHGVSANSASPVPPSLAPADTVRIGQRIQIRE